MSIQTIAKRDTNEEVVQANFRLPKKLMDDLKQIADSQAMSMTVIVDSAIRAKLKELSQTDLVLGI